jgi:hypothetical protein
MNYDIAQNYEYAEYERGSYRTGKYIFWSLLGLSSLVGGFLYYAGAPIVGLVFIGVVLAGSAIVAPQLAFYLYFGWQAFDAVFLSGPKAVFTPAKVFALFIIAVYLISVGRIRHKILLSKPVIGAMFMFGLFGLLLSFQSIAPLVSVRYSLQILVQLVIVLGALHFLDSAERIRTAFLCCFLGGVAAGIMMIVTGGISASYGRGTLGEYANPNTTGLALSVSFIALPGLWVTKKFRIYYLPCIVGALFILIGILNTGSRAALVAVFMALGTGALFAKGAGLFRRFLIPATIIILIGGSVLYLISLNVLQEKSQERLDAMISRQESGEGYYVRSYIWKRALSTYSEHNPLFGFGFGNTAPALAIHRGEYRDIHSSLIGPLVDSGPIGFGLFCTGLILLFVKVRNIKDVRMNIIATMIFMFILLSSLTHTIHFTKWFWIPVTMCLLLVEQSKRQEYADLHEPQRDSEMTMLEDSYSDVGA